MNISKSSWHYKFNKTFRDTYSLKEVTSLCEYVRYTMFTCLVPVMLLCALTIVSGLFLYATGLIFCDLVLHIPKETIITWKFSPFVVMASIFVDAMIVGFWALITYRKLIFKKIKSVFKTKAKQEEEIEIKKEPNIFVEYIKAKKSKICPMIEFID